MPVRAAAYRVGKKLIGAVPSWAFRARPMSVFEVTLADRQAGAATRTFPHQEPIDGERIGWVASAEEAVALGPLAAEVNRLAWNNETCRVAAVWSQGQPTGCLWVARGAYEETDLGLRIELAADEAWLFAAAVVPSRRREGVYRRLFDFVLTDLASAGTRRALLAVTWGNHASRVAHLRFGARQIGGIAAVRVLGVAVSLPQGAVQRRGSPLACRAVSVRIA